jgi:diacylglycerol kinase
MVSWLRMESRHSIVKSFKFAFDGLKVAILKGRNFRIQLIAGFIAVILACVFKINISEWLGLVIVITLVLILELVNTSIEEIVNIVSPEIHEKAKIAKDVAAATVLVASIGSVLVGGLLFLPRILVFLSR